MWWKKKGFLKDPEGIARQMEISRLHLFLLDRMNLAEHAKRDLEVELTLLAVLANRVIAEVKTKAYIA
ncbi:MAG: hypothetical protein ACTSV6_05675 [Candidatus Heimdallarchaeota archaeon]